MEQKVNIHGRNPARAGGRAVYAGAEAYLTMRFPAKGPAGTPGLVGSSNRMARVHEPPDPLEQGVSGVHGYGVVGVHENIVAGD